MATPAVEGSHDAVRSLVHLFEYRVHIVSKAGPKIAQLTRLWLGAQGFLAEGGLPSENVHFVRKRADKHPVCDRLGITHFIDDRPDVLQHLVTVDCRYLFTGGLGANKAPKSVSPRCEVVDSWSRLVGLLERDSHAR